MSIGEAGQRPRRRRRPQTSVRRGSTSIDRPIVGCLRDQLQPRHRGGASSVRAASPINSSFRPSGPARVGGRWRSPAHRLKHAPRRSPRRIGSHASSRRPTRCLTMTAVESVYIGSTSDLHAEQAITAGPLRQARTLRQALGLDARMPVRLSTRATRPMSYSRPITISATRPRIARSGGRLRARLAAADRARRARAAR